MDALVRSQPDVALIAFGHAGDGEAPGIHLLALQSTTVQAHDEQTVAVDADQHLSGAGYEQGRAGTVFLIAGETLEGVDDLVGIAVQHKHTTVVHVHPHVLRLVDDDVQNAVVQVLDAAGITCLIVVEIIAVVARQPVPGGNPDVAEVVLGDHGDGIAAEPVFCGEMRARGL